MGNVNFNEEFKDKGLKIAALTVLILAILVIGSFTIITIVKINNGGHVKVFGLEYNIPREHPDTVFKPVAAKPDTVFKFKPSPFVNKPTVLNRSKPHASNSIDTTKRTVSPPTIQAKNYAGVNNGGQVGDSYYGTQLDFTEDYGNYFINTIENFRKDSSIISKSLVLEPFVNCNSQKFGIDLMNFLKSKAYRVSIRYNVLSNGPAEGVGISFNRKIQCFEVEIGNMYNNKQ